MKVIGYEIFNLASSANADDGRIILFPLLTSGFPINAGEYALNYLMKILLAAGGLYPILPPPCLPPLSP